MKRKKNPSETKRTARRKRHRHRVEVKRELETDGDNQLYGRIPELANHQQVQEAAIKMEIENDGETPTDPLGRIWEDYQALTRRIETFGNSVQQIRTDASEANESVRQLKTLYSLLSRTAYSWESMPSNPMELENPGDQSTAPVGGILDYLALPSNLDAAYPWQSIHRFPWQSAITYPWEAMPRYPSPPLANPFGLANMGLVFAEGIQNNPVAEESPEKSLILTLHDYAEDRDHWEGEMFVNGQSIEKTERVTLNWLKTNFCKASNLLLLLNNDLPNILQNPPGKWEGASYGDFRKYVKDESRLNRVQIFAGKTSSNLEPLIDIFNQDDTGITIQVTLSEGQYLLHQPLSFVSKIDKIEIQEELSVDTLNKILENTDLDDFHFRCDQVFPTERFVEEWKKGKRIITKWRIDYPLTDHDNEPQEEESADSGHLKETFLSDDRKTKLEMTIKTCREEKKETVTYTESETPHGPWIESIASALEFNASSLRNFYNPTAGPACNLQNIASTLKLFSKSLENIVNPPQITSFGGYPYHHLYNPTHYDSLFNYSSPTYYPYHL